MRMAMATTKLGILSPRFLARSTISLNKVVKSEKALSRIMHAIEGSRSPYIKAVAAPMDRPQRAMLETFPVDRR